MIDILKTFTEVIKALNRRRIRYCVIGGMAVRFFAKSRFTDDIDFLVDAKDIPRIRAIMELLDIPESIQPWTFKSTSLTLHRFLKIEGSDTLPIDVLAAADERHLKIVGDAVRARSDSGVVRVARPEDLIWLKGKRNSDADKDDIERLRNASYRRCFAQNK